MKLEAKGKGDTIRAAELLDSGTLCRLYPGVVKLRADRLSKEVQIQDPAQDQKYNFDLLLLHYIQAGLSPSKICKMLRVKKQALQYHLDKLQRWRLISKVGYGVWEVSKTALDLQNRSTKSTQVTLDKALGNLYLLRRDSVRGHAFMFTLQVPPELQNWTNRKRELYLTENGIAFTMLNIPGGGQRLIFKGRKVWLTNPSVIIYEKGSYFADTAKLAKKLALAKLLSLVKSLERSLHADFTFRAGREYRFKVSRQHYALVKNSLAEQYDHEGKKLMVSNSQGLWFVIDNSFNFHEAETVHPETADLDNGPVQEFFNSLKDHPVTPEFILEAMAGIVRNQMLYSENMRAHVQAVQNLGDGVAKLNDLLAALNVVLADAKRLEEVNADQTT